METLGLQDQVALREGLRSVREAFESAVDYAKGMAGSATEKTKETSARASEKTVDEASKLASSAKEQVADALSEHDL